MIYTKLADISGFVAINSSQMSGPWQRSESGTKNKFMAMPRNPAETLARADMAADPGRNEASEGVNPGGKPRQLARHRILVHDAFGGRPVQLRLGDLEG